MKTDCNGYEIVAEKTFSFGKHPVFSKRKVNEIVLKVALKKDRKGNAVFTGSGEVWNGRHTDILAGGQCIDTIPMAYYKPIGRDPLYAKIRRLWENNANNDLTAGSPRQEKAVAEYRKTHENCGYEEVCAMLKRKHLYRDSRFIYRGKPYAYGTAWLTKPISREDLAEMCELLGCDKENFKEFAD